MGRYTYIGVLTEREFSFGLLQFLFSNLIIFGKIKYVFAPFFRGFRPRRTACFGAPFVLASAVNITVQVVIDLSQQQ